MDNLIIIQIIVISLLVGIGLISFSTVGFSFRAYLEKKVWAGIPKIIFLIGIILAVVSSVILLFI